jgi:hypothetical protein
LESNVTDYSADALTVTANGGFGYGNPGSAPFGANAAYLENPNGNDGDNIEITYDTKLLIGTKPFTFSFWIHPVAINGIDALLCNSTAAGTSNIMIYLYNNNIYYYSKGGFRIQVAHGMSVDNWYHIALARESIAANKLKLFVNGALIKTGTDSNDLDYTSNWTIGWCKDTTALGAINGFYGYIKNVSIHIGQCIYNRGFTPPNRAS